MSFDDFPIGDFLFLAVAFFIISFGISLLITAALSEDKEHGIIRQMWATFFGTRASDQPDNPDSPATSDDSPHDSSSPRGD